MTDIQQISKAQSLEQSDYLLLFKVTTKDQFVLTVSASRQIEFQGETYEFLPNVISGLHESTSGELSRPTWSISNPQGVLTKMALSPSLLGARVELFRGRLQQLRFQQCDGRLMASLPCSFSQYTGHIRTA